VGLLLAGGVTAGAAPLRAAVVATPANAAVDEGISGWTRVSVEIRLAAPAPAAVTIAYRTKPGTAGRDDFRATSGTLRIRRGARKGTIDVDVRGDTRDEAHERFTIALLRPHGARLARASVTVMIRNDDDVPVGPVGATTPGRPSPPPAMPLAAPTLAGTFPVTPSADPMPRLVGSAPAGAAIEVYAGEGCAGTPVATGPAAALGTGSIAVPVTPNAATVLSARAVLGDRRSACSTPTTYVHDTTPPAPPVLLRTVPGSPSTVNVPAVVGTVAADVVRVELHAADACAGPGVTVTPAALAVGAQVSVPSDAATRLTAIAIDAAGNRSACSAPLLYVEDSTDAVAATAARFA